MNSIVDTKIFILEMNLSDGQVSRIPYDTSEEAIEGCKTFLKDNNIEDVIGIDCRVVQYGIVVLEGKRLPVKIRTIWERGAFGSDIYLEEK